MARFKDADWNLIQASNGSVQTWEQASIAVLMDIRDELKRLNDAIYCPNALAIPRILRQIQSNTKKPAKRRKRLTP